MMEWHDYYFGFARHAATKSKDSTQVGAAIIGPNGEIRMTGYNGPPKGVLDLPERRERPAKYKFTAHAEQNAIAFAARNGVPTDDCIMYVTHMPCAGCMKSIIQAGIRAVFIGDGTTSMPTDEFEAAEIMANEANVKVTRL